MRKITILFASAAIIAAVCSCVREENFQEIEPVDPGTVSLVLGGIETRSETPSTVETFTYRLGEDGNGHIFTLDETVTEMGDLGDAPRAPRTKGSPAYTSNVAAVYGGSFNGVIYGGSSQIAGDGPFAESGGFWRRFLGSDPWVSNDELTFFLRMPASANGMSGLAYNTTAKTVSFDYTTPATASDQQDILFATRTVDKATYDSELASAGGAKVLFRHALTGVKFAIGNNTTDDDERFPEDEVQTFITKVEIKGLKDKGSAVFSPDNSQEEDADNTDVYSSRSSFTWTIDDTSTDAVFTQTYDQNNIVDFVSGDDYDGADSFYAAGQNRNLNDSQASLTFWFIPQDITTALEIDVTFYVWNGVSQGEEVTMTLNLGQLIAAQSSTINKTWKAGQLRTFSLSPGVVDVEITDEMSDDKTEKSNVVIKNTGNKDAYMRVAIVGNWVNTATGEIVAPWDADNTTYGSFVGLPGTGWTKKSDGFWYYSEVVEPGKSPAVNIFTTYTVGTAPTVEGVESVGLIMDLIVQAVDAAARSTCEDAWNSVL